MADYQFNTNLGPAAQQGTNIADMVNLARGVQAYQQAQELNPLAVQKAQMEVEQAKKLNPLAVRKATEEVSQAETSTKKGKLGLSQDQTKIINDNIGSVLNDERLTDPNPQRRATPLIEARQRVINGGVDPVMAEIMFAPLLDKAMRDKNPTAVKDMMSSISNIQQSGIGATGQQALQTPQLATVAGAPATFQSGTGTAKELNIGGQGNTGLAQPPAISPNVGAAPTGVTPTQMSLPYPVRKAGDIRPLAPTEEKDKEAGFTYRDSLTKATQKLSTSLRNLDEVIKTAEKVGEKEWMGGAGLLGAAGRNLSVALGTEQGVDYKRLSKDLANLQISLGADTSTDAGKQLLAAASGEITLPPDVLVEIARRTRADRQNIEMQTKGAQVFSQKYGDANLKKFQEDWTNNSKDSKVFEAISIYNSDMSKEDKQKEINKLFAGASPSYLAKVKQYKNNLMKLSETGGL